MKPSKNKYICFCWVFLYLKICGGDYIHSDFMKKDILATANTKSILINSGGYYVI